MWYAIIAEDTPGTLATRLEVRPRHLARLEQLKADGRLLLQSTGFDAPKEAGQAIAQLQKDSAALQTLAPRLVPVDGVDAAEVTAALQALAEAAAAA